MQKVKIFLKILSGGGLLFLKHPVYEVLRVLFKEPILGPLKFKMEEIRHFENREIAISQRKIIRFQLNLVHKCRFRTR